MKIVPIFTTDNYEAGLWTIHLDGESLNEFDQFFDLINDIEWLYNFFENNKADLMNGFFGNMIIGEAILRTLKESEKMEELLYDYTEKGFDDNGDNLQHLFKPLNNFEYTITVHQKSKARISKGWLRLYAIRLAENCYLVTGGAIKQTQDMKRNHLKNELVKLEKTKTFLRDNGIDFPEDLNSYLNE